MLAPAPLPWPSRPRPTRVGVSVKLEQVNPDRNKHRATFAVIADVIADVIAADACSSFAFCAVNASFCACSSASQARPTL